VAKAAFLELPTVEALAVLDILVAIRYRFLFLEVNILLELLLRR
jgi:hypothetical protein